MKNLIKDFDVSNCKIMAFPVDKNVEFGYFLQLYVKLINLKIYYYYYE